jgi:hypothetical protein
MDYCKVLMKNYADCSWICGDTYESIEWNEETIEKPTQEKMIELYDLILIDEMRDKRNQLLQECDFRVLPDYTKDKELWINYRQELRDLPETWTTGDEFPEPPE